MKRVAFITTLLFLIGIFLSCHKNKNDDNSSKTCGTVYTPTNSNMIIGGSCWTFDSCKVAVCTMKGVCGSTTVEINAGGPYFIPSTYALTSGVPTYGQARIKITNPPAQPFGIWYSTMGSVSITTGTAGSIATFTNINCNQSSSSNPTVVASGTMVCY